MLSNDGWDRKPLLSIVLVGLPELWDRVQLRANRSLGSRIHYRKVVPIPEPTDTVEYIDHRLEQVGNKNHPFTPDALTMLVVADTRDPSRRRGRTFRLSRIRKASPWPVGRRITYMRSEISNSNSSESSP